nr:hypothetical protein CCACVL1_29395 [Ipomoea batatas]
MPQRAPHEVDKTCINISTESDAHDDNLSESLANDSHVSQQQEQPRRSSRQVSRPAYLKDYSCTLPATRTSPHTLSAVLSYDKEVAPLVGIRESHQGGVVVAYVLPGEGVRPIGENGVSAVKRRRRLQEVEVADNRKRHPRKRRKTATPC